MALRRGSYIMRPSGDISVKHSLNGKNTAWGCLADSTDSSYISTNSTSNVTTSVSMTVSEGDIPSLPYVITSIEIHARHKVDFNNSGTGYFKYGISVNSWSNDGSLITRTSKSTTDWSTNHSVEISMAGNETPSASCNVSSYRKSALMKYDTIVYDLYVVVNYNYTLPELWLYTVGSIHPDFTFGCKAELVNIEEVESGIFEYYYILDERETTITVNDSPGENIAWAFPSWSDDTVQVDAAKDGVYELPLSLIDDESIMYMFCYKTGYIGSQRMSQYKGVYAGDNIVKRVYSGDTLIYGDENFYIGRDHKLVRDN